MKTTVAHKNSSRNISDENRALVIPAWQAGFLLAGLTLLAFSSTFGRNYIWDDSTFISGTHAMRSLSGLWRIWFDVGTQQYYPLTFTSLWIEDHLWGMSPAGHHVINVLLHAVGAVVLWRVLMRLGAPCAWLAAAVFAVHPVQVESVAWVSERKNVLSGLFYLLSANAYFSAALAGDQTGDQASAKKRAAVMYTLAWVFFVCALGAKTVVVTLPAVLVLVLWWKHRLTWRHAIALAPMFAVGIAMGRLTAHLEASRVGAVGADYDFSFADRILIAGRALWFYAGKLVWPADLMFIYPRWNIDPREGWQWIFPAAALATMAALWFLRDRIGRGPLVAVLFFAGTLVPALGFVNVYPMRYSFVADHFQYLASIGLLTLAVAVGYRLLQRFKSSPMLMRVVSIGLIFALAAHTWGRVWIFDDAETLWRDTIARNPGAWIAYNNLGTILQVQGNPEEAADAYRAALAIKPALPESLLNLGKIEIDAGNLDEGIAHVREAMRLSPAFTEGYFFIGQALEKKGDVAGAIAMYEKAIDANPTFELPRRALAKLRASPHPTTR